MSLRILPRNTVDARPLRGKVRHSLRSSIVGALVLLVYGGGLAYLRLEHGLPLFFVVVNAPVFALFVWYWARTLRRVLSGHLPFLLATTDTTLLVPLATLERTLSPELDLYLELPFADIESARLVDARYRFAVQSAGRRTTRLTRVSTLTLKLYEPSDGALEEALARFKRVQGFQGVSVHVAAPDVLELSLVGHESRIGAAKRLLAKAAPRLAPATEVVRESPGSEAPEEEVLAVAARLESFGSGLAGKQLLAARGVEDEVRARRAAERRAKLAERSRAG